MNPLMGLLLHDDYDSADWKQLRDEVNSELEWVAA